VLTRFAIVQRNVDNYLSVVLWTVSKYGTGRSQTASPSTLLASCLVYFVLLGDEAQWSSTHVREIPAVKLLVRGWRFESSRLQFADSKSATNKKRWHFVSAFFLILFTRGTL